MRGIVGFERADGLHTGDIDHLPGSAGVGHQAREVLETLCVNLDEVSGAERRDQCGAVIGIEDIAGRPCRGARVRKHGGVENNLLSVLRQSLTLGMNACESFAQSLSLLGQSLGANAARILAAACDPLWSGVLCEPQYWIQKWSTCGFVSHRDPPCRPSGSGAPSAG